MACSICESIKQNLKQTLTIVPTRSHVGVAHINAYPSFCVKCWGLVAGVWAQIRISPCVKIQVRMKQSPAQMRRGRKAMHPVALI